MSLRDPPPRLRWNRSQRFVLSPRGREVEEEYLTRIVASRENAGRDRDSFDAARTTWAQVHRLQPDDGLYLAEIRPGPLNVAQLIERLVACGKSRNDAIAAMERLVDSGLVAMHREEHA